MTPKLMRYRARSGSSSRVSSLVVTAQSRSSIDPVLLNPLCSTIPKLFSYLGWSSEMDAMACSSVMIALLRSSSINPVLSNLLCSIFAKQLSIAERSGSPSGVPCHNRLIDIVHRSCPLESIEQHNQIVDVHSAIGMVIWSGYDSPLVRYNRLIEIIR